MWNQTVTLYHKNESGDSVIWTRRVLRGVHLRLSSGDVLSTSGIVTSGSSVLLVRNNADREVIDCGDYVVRGNCSTGEFSGSARKTLDAYKPMRITGVTEFAYLTGMDYASYTLGGKS